MNIILGTAGHIDHGKSSLVKALTGTDPDRLPEEKARGVTIELGFAHLTIPHPKGHDDFQVGVIDVPGHADFINNMVAGVGALDVVLFVVAADDCWMPQSEEHLHVLSYLGATNAVIALTKSDICEDIEFTTEILREELEGSPLADAPIIPVSSHTGEGLDVLKKELGNRFFDITAKRSSADHGRARLAVDRSFSPQGIGTVVTGTLSGSSISVGNPLILQPEGLECHVRQIQNHNSQLETGFPSMRTALNVPDLPLSERGKPGVKRGGTLVAPDSGPTTQTVDVHIRRIARQIPGQSQSIGPLKLPRKIIVHMGTAHLGARLISLDQAELMPGDSAFCELRFDKPAHCFIGDHFVIRDASKLSTLAGGVVLDPLADRRRFHRDAQRELLETRLQNPDKVDVQITSALARDHILPADCPITLTGFSKAALQKSAAKLKKTGKLTTIGDFLVSPEWWKNISAAAGQLIHSHHEKEPDQPGLEVNKLISALAEDLPSDKAADLLILGLTSRGFVKKGDQIASEDHHLSLPPELEAAADKVMTTLNANPLTPPTRSAVLTTPAEEKAFAFLLRSKQVIELEPKVIISTSAYNQMKQSVVSHLNSTEEATASQLRDTIGTTRKVLMPLLELLDSQGITRRQGDVRVLR